MSAGIVSFSSPTPDQEYLIGVTREMARAQNADQIMRFWAQDVIWFDITAESLRGYDKVKSEFSAQFDKLVSCDADILEIDCFVSGDIGIVCSRQKFHAVPKSGDQDHHLTTRQTDCFRRDHGEWELIHQHISLPTV